MFSTEDSAKVYTKVEMEKLSHPGHILTLAMINTWLVTGRKAQILVVSVEMRLCRALW